MSLIVIEGARKSGKTYLINSQKVFPTFKFQFNEAFTGLGFEKNSTNVHYLGIGKELMLHQLDRDGFLKKDFRTDDGRRTDSFIVDRGIISNTVWGVFQKRIPLKKAENELKWAIESGLLKDAIFIGINGTSLTERKKDMWDNDDLRIQEEIDLFNHFYNIMESYKNQVYRFTNNFDPESIENFDNFLKSI